MNDTFYELCKGQANDDFHKMKVLAGICMTRFPCRDESTEVPEVISIGTGTKTIQGANFTTHGTALFDCHGEIIARRGFKRFLYSQLMLIARDPMADSIFMMDQNVYKLRPGIKFHLYINTATCGDARLFNPNDKEDLPDEHASRMNRGILRTKIENGEGTIPIQAANSVLTWDGIMANGRLLTMSCSDKVMRWNVLGMQGSLLSQFIEPIFVSSIVLGMLYHNQHFKRAMYARLAKTGVPVKQPMLAVTTNQPDRRAKNAPDFSVNWSRGSEETLEMVQTATGMVSENQASRLSKARLFDLYAQLVAQMAYDVKWTADLKLNKTTYGEAKAKSIDYNGMKERLNQSMRASGVGIWVAKPGEVNGFVTSSPLEIDRVDNDGFNAF